VSIILIGGKIKKEKKILEINIKGKIIYLKKYEIEYPDINTSNTNKIIINTTVDKLDCIIKNPTIIEGSNICLKKIVNEYNLSLYNTRFLHKKSIRLYLANSDG